MKPITLALLTAAALAVNSARADTRVSFGFNIGGPVCRTETPVVVYAPPPVAVYAPAPAHGHWEDVVVKTWVSERWLSSRDRWGRPVRVFEPGYFTYRTERVWIDLHSHYGHDNRGGHGYGYNPSLGDWNR